MANKEPKTFKVNAKSIKIAKKNGENVVLKQNEIGNVEDFHKDDLIILASNGQMGIGKDKKEYTMYKSSITFLEDGELKTDDLPLSVEEELKKEDAIKELRK